jgi:hypothetical protein
MRLVPAAALVVLLAAPAAAQQAGSLPPPVPRPAEPAPAATNDAAPARQPGLGERTGAAIDRAADSTGSAVGRAMRWTGEQMQGAGSWTARQGERLTGPQQPAAEPAPSTR